MAPPLFEWGVRDLQGFVVTDPELCAAVIRGEKPELTVFSTGRRVNIPGREAFRGPEREGIAE
jgi:hypothetical protein